MQHLVQFGPTFHLPHCTPAAINMKRVISISLLGPHNVMFLLTTSLLVHPWIFAQRSGIRILSYYLGSRSACSKDILLEVRNDYNHKTLISLLGPKRQCLLSVIHQSIRDAMTRLHTSHQDIRTYFSDTTAAEPTTATTPTATTAPTTSTAGTRFHLPAIRQRFRHARTQLATISIDIRRFFPGRSGAI
jgi:hypothetical protein